MATHLEYITAQMNAQRAAYEEEVPFTRAYAGYRDEPVLADEAKALKLTYYQGIHDGVGMGSGSMDGIWRSRIAIARDNATPEAQPYLEALLRRF